MTIFVPSIKLLEEIVDEKTFYSGIKGFLLWNIMATFAAPWTLIILLSNNNKKRSETFAITLADTLLEDDEDDE